MRLEASVLLNAEYCLRCCLDLSTLVNTAFSLQLFLISSLSAFPLSHLLGQMLQKWTNTENILPSGNTVRAIVIFHALKFLYLSHTSSSLWKRATQNQKYYIVTFGNMSFDLFFLFFFSRTDTSHLIDVILYLKTSTKSHFSFIFLFSSAENYKFHSSHRCLSCL